MTNSFKLGARYSIKLISCQKCPYGVSNCNSFSWLSGPSGLLSLSCSQEGCLHRTNTSWIWATMTLLQQISDILAQSSWAQKKKLWAVVWLFVATCRILQRLHCVTRTWFCQGRNSADSYLFTNLETGWFFHMKPFPFMVLTIYRLEKREKSCAFPGCKASLL